MSFGISTKSLSRDDKVAAIFVFVVLMISAVIFGVVEWRFYVEYVLQKSVGIDPVWIINMFNWVSMLVFVVLIVQMLLIINLYISRGMMSRAMAFVVVGIISIPLWTMIHSYVVTVMLPTDPMEWQLWMYVTRIQFLPGWYVPGWWILLIGFLIFCITWTSFSIARRRTRRRR